MPAPAAPRQPSFALVEQEPGWAGLNQSNVRFSLRGLAALSLVTATLAGAGAAPTHAAAPTGVPKLHHVFVIVLENEDFANTWDTDPYLKSLTTQGAFADQYYAASHLSADNYIAMTSGQTPTMPFQSDCQVWSYCYASEKARLDEGRNITDQLTGAGLTWGAYMESMGTPCKHPALTDGPDPNSKGYATRHNPFAYYPTIVDHSAYCAAHVRDYNDLVPLLKSGNEDAVPNYVFISPDTCDDGHDAPCADARPGGLHQADLWLQNNLPTILGSAAYHDDGAVFITFDEASNTDEGGCCATGILADGTNGGGRVGLVMLSDKANVNHATDAFYDHNSLLRTVEDAFGISEHLNNAGSDKVRSMADLFEH